MLRKFFLHALDLVAELLHAEYSVGVAGPRLLSQGGQSPYGVFQLRFKLDRFWIAFFTQGVMNAAQVSCPRSHRTLPAKHFGIHLLGRSLRADGDVKVAVHKLP